MSLGKRSVQSLTWNTGSHALQLIILFTRSVMLARLLSPEVFGIYAFAQAIIQTTKSLPAFGLGTAYVHRSPESQHVDALGVYFTLISSFTLIWAILLAAGAALLADHEQRWVFWILVATTFISTLTAPAYAVLVKRVSFRRHAILSLITTLLATLIALFLAWNGGGIWSLLSVDVVTAVVLVLGYYVIRPVWRPRLVWSLPIVRYFLKYGSRLTLAGVLSQATDRLDDIWTGYFLGDIALGFYSRAYTFANYPRKMLVSPVYGVASGIYAEVKNDRKRLSQVFFWINSLVIRGSFLLSGILLLISPEFVGLVLGEKWLPMLDAFRLMVVYAMLDPIRFTVGTMFSAIGQPEVVVRTQIIQLVVLAIGVSVLGPYYGIAGVAVSATSMVVIGACVLVWQARKYVDFSVLRLFGVPTISLVIGILAAYGSISISGLVGSYWQIAITKLVVFVPVYVVIVASAERRLVYEMLRFLKPLLLKSR